MTSATATALNNRANIWRRQNKLTEAKRDYLAALAAGSDNWQFPYYGLGQIAEVQHDVDAARGFYAKALAADPHYGLAADRLAALGGKPEVVLIEPGKIMLHPPDAMPTRSAAPAQALADTSVTLHPPHSFKPTKPHTRSEATNPGLRPALDGPTDGTQPQVQLGAWRSEPEAQAGWDKARSRAGEILDGLNAHVEMVDLPGRGRYFRLRLVTPTPARLCTLLKPAGQDCAPVR